MLLRSAALEVVVRAFRIVMAGHSRPKDGAASLAYVPAIRVFLYGQDVDPATSAGMTTDRAEKTDRH
jgi:hypothetical protein